MIDVADAARLRVVRLFGSHARTLLVPRDVRVAWTGALLSMSAFAATGLLPMWVLAAGPIVWGIPHVLADVRYLVVRPGYHRRIAALVPFALALVLGWAGAGLAGVLAMASVAALVARGSVLRRALVASALAALAIVAHRAPSTSTLVFAHLHNAIALGFFVLWRRRDRAIALAPAAVAVVLGALILAGALDAAMPTSLGSANFDDLAMQLAPPDLVADPRLARRLVLLYGFGQSMHYVVWLRLVPEEDRPRPRSFRQSVRALASDLGWVPLAIAALLAFALAGWAFVDLAEARYRYLQIAFFHGWIEIVAAAVLLVEGRRAR